MTKLQHQLEQFLFKWIKPLHCFRKPGNYFMEYPYRTVKLQKHNKTLKQFISRLSRIKPINCMVLTWENSLSFN